MKFQKILCFVSLILAALVIVFSFCFVSGCLYNAKMYSARRGDPLGMYDLSFAAQNVSNTMLIIGIIFLLAVVTLFIMATNTRRKYYITNYISIGLVTVMALVVAIVGIVTLSNCVAEYSLIDWAACQKTIEANPLQYTNGYSDNIVTVYLGYVLCGIMVVLAAAHALNLVWKIKLMQGEKKLLESGSLKEAA